MSSRPVFIILPLCFTIISSKEDEKSGFSIPEPKNTAYQPGALLRSDEEKFDKVLGALVVSAIGDAMGTSTEMWHRDQIQAKYGYITSLTAAVRPQSPEGIWGNNLVEGATTDDTRWKFLMVRYLSENENSLDAAHFSQYINSYYRDMVKALNDEQLQTDTNALEVRIKKIDWIKEWARVSLAYGEGSEAYLKALNRFYGGEMACAGQLYSPLLGLIAANAETAYTSAYQHAIFDLGYARDITGLVAAMTHIAMRTQNVDSIINTAAFVDPYGYQDSRLVGRIPLTIANASVQQVRTAQKLDI